MEASAYAGRHGASFSDGTGTGMVVTDECEGAADAARGARSCTAELELLNCNNSMSFALASWAFETVGMLVGCSGGNGCRRFRSASRNGLLRKAETGSCGDGAGAGAGGAFFSRCETRPLGARSFVADRGVGEPGEDCANRCAFALATCSGSTVGATIPFEIKASSQLSVKKSLGDMAKVRYKLKVRKRGA